MSMLHVHVNAAFHVECFMSMSMSIDIYIEMPDCPASGQSGTGLKKLTPNAETCLVLD